MSRSMIADPPAHISSPTTGLQLSGYGFAWRNNAFENGVEPDGICHCDPQPESSPVGQCPRCHRLDARKAFA